MTDGPPSAAPLHLVGQDGSFVTHYGVTDDANPVVRYDDKIQPFLHHLVEPRPKRFDQRRAGTQISHVHPVEHARHGRPLRVR